MFADDTCISYSANTTDELQNAIKSELKSLWYFMVRSRQKLRIIGSEINIRINKNEITRVQILGSVY